jgi:hypothetical protein
MATGNLLVDLAPVPVNVRSAESIVCATSASDPAGH